MARKDFQFDLFSIEKCRELLSKLVEIDTSQPEGNEARLVDFIEARYEGTSALCTRIDHGNNRASLVVKLPGKSETGAVAFIGHLDTVACGDLSLWSSPPLAATVKENVLFGRGAADMKGGIAAMLLVLDDCVANAQPLNKSVLFCFTADEEKDGTGARALVENGLLEDLDGLIVCEPTRESIGLFEKGALWVRVSAGGVSGHASRPELGVNAIEALLNFAVKARGSLDVSQKHEYLGNNTMSVTRFQGGHMTNVIPSSAFVELDIRTLPGVSHEDMILKLGEICRELEAELSRLKLNLEIINNRPPLEIEATAEFVVKIQACAEERAIRLGKRGLFFYTDASQIVPALGVPFVIMGPGDDRQAHKMDEHIELSSVALFARLYAGFVEDYCRSSG